MLRKTGTNLPPKIHTLLGTKRQRNRLELTPITVQEDGANKINSHEFNLPAIQFLTYQNKKCIKPMYKIKVVWLSSSLWINGSTLYYEQARPIGEGERRHKNIFAHVIQFIMMNGRYTTCFSDTRCNFGRGGGKLECNLTGTCHFLRISTTSLGKNIAFRYPVSKLLDYKIFPKQ